MVRDSKKKKAGEGDRLCYGGAVLCGQVLQVNPEGGAISIFQAEGGAGTKALRGYDGDV